MGGREYLCRTIQLCSKICAETSLCRIGAHGYSIMGANFGGLTGRGILSIDLTIVGVIVSTYTVATYSHLHDHASLSIYSHTN